MTMLTLSSNISVLMLYIPLMNEERIKDKADDKHYQTYP